MKRYSIRIAVLAFVLVLLPLASLASGTVLLNNFGRFFETGGFPDSEFSDTLAGVGVVTAVDPVLTCDLTTNELTWSIRDLISLGQFSPDGGRTIIVSYSGGVLDIHSDPEMNYDFGLNPPNATVPATFEDGSLFLNGAFTQFVLFYDSLYRVGSFQGLVNFTTGTNLTNLGNPNGMIFAGTIGPELDPNIPEGYDLGCVGRIVAPSLCTVRGNVSYTYDADQCLKIRGHRRLQFHYRGTGDPTQATVNDGAVLTIVGNELTITPEWDEGLPDETVLSVGYDRIVLDTSGARNIDSGNEIGMFTVTSIDKIIAPCNDETSGGIHRMRLRYIGVCDPATVSVSPEAYAAPIGNLIEILPIGDRLPAGTEITIGEDRALIPTSGTQPLEVGYVFGEFVVDELEKMDSEIYDGVILPNGPIVGATVDLVDGAGSIFSTLTDENGNYVFFDAATDTLTVSVVSPLGYSALTATDSTVVCAAGNVAVVDFLFKRVATMDCPRSVGFWKHQVNFALLGKQRGVQVTAAELLTLFEQIHARFDQYFDVFIPVETLSDFRDILSPRMRPPMSDLARSQFLTLLLNVVSNRLGTWQFISEDQATVSQAITYVSYLLTDDEDANDELAKDIAMMINNEMTVSGDIIPLDTVQIAYRWPGGERDADSRLPSILESFGNYPNPFNPLTTVTYELKNEAQVDVAIYDIHGHRIKSLVSGVLQRGRNTISWQGNDDFGRAVPSGKYFCQLRVGGQVATRQMTMIR